MLQKELKHTGVASTEISSLEKEKNGIQCSTQGAALPCLTEIDVESLPPNLKEIVLTLVSLVLGMESMMNSSDRTALSIFAAKGHAERLGVSDVAFEQGVRMLLQYRKNRRKTPMEEIFD